MLLSHALSMLQGCTALMLAVEYGQADAAKLLLEAGVDSDLANNKVTPSQSLGLIHYCSFHRLDRVWFRKVS